MNDWIKKQWTSFLGALLIICAFLYLFKYTVDQGWITDSIKVGIGILVGAGLAIAGYKLLLVGAKMVGEIIGGLGAAVLYTTFSFAGIYYDMWDSLTVFLCMLAVTAGVSVAAYKLDLRILMNIALIGGLVSPLVLRPENDQVFTLFLYLLVINAVYFYLSIRKNWAELRLGAFAGTWLLYIVYFFHFDPLVDQWWSMPFRYATAAFLFYVIGFLVSSWNNANFDGLNLYLGIVNAVLYGLWALTLLEDFVSFAYPLGLAGLLYLTVAHFVFPLEGRRFTTPVLTKLLGGLFLLLLAAAQFGKGWDIKPLLNVYLWGAVAAGLLAFGQARKLDAIRWASLLVWACIGFYWFTVTWETPRGEWFGVYIPFLNWGAISWMVLAAYGFYFSLHVRFKDLTNTDNKMLSIGTSVLSHLVVGGLLTVQVDNMFDEYGWTDVFDKQLALSLAWGVYAMLLFLWGAYNRQVAYKALGGGVLVIVALKVLFRDLAGEETIYKVIVLFLLGAISFAFSYINNRWSDDDGTGTDPHGGQGRGIGAFGGGYGQHAQPSGQQTQAQVEYGYGHSQHPQHPQHPQQYGQHPQAPSQLGYAQQQPGPAQGNSGQRPQAETGPGAPEPEAGSPDADTKRNESAPGHNGPRLGRPEDFRGSGEGTGHSGNM